MPGGWWVKFHREVWDDADFNKLGADAKVIWLWAWTSPSASNTGLVRASYRSLARVLHRQGRVTTQRVKTALKQLAAKPLALYDEEWEILYVPTRTRWVLEHETVGARAMVAMLLDYEEFPADSALVKRWRKQYPRIVKDAEGHREQLRERGRRGGSRKPDPIHGATTKQQPEKIVGRAVKPKIKRIP